MSVWVRVCVRARAETKKKTPAANEELSADAVSADEISTPTSVPGFRRMFRL